MSTSIYNPYIDIQKMVKARASISKSGNMRVDNWTNTIEYPMVYRV